MRRPVRSGSVRSPKLEKPAAPVSSRDRLAMLLALAALFCLGAAFILAQDTELDRRVALKVLPAELSRDPDRLRRFVLEAKAASAFNHPNVATIYEVREWESVHFIAMEYI